MKGNRTFETYSSLSRWRAPRELVVLLVREFQFLDLRKISREREGERERERERDGMRR